MIAERAIQAIYRAIVPRQEGSPRVFEGGNGQNGFAVNTHLLRTTREMATAALLVGIMAWRVKLSLLTLYDTPRK